MTKLKYVVAFVFITTSAVAQVYRIPDDGKIRQDGRCEVCSADIFAWVDKPTERTWWGGDSFGGGFNGYWHRDPAAEHVMSVGFLPVKMCESCFTKFNAGYVERMKRLHNKLLADFMDEQTDRRTELETIRQKQAIIDREKRIKDLEQEIWDLHHPEEAAKRRKAGEKFYWDGEVLVLSLDSLISFQPIIDTLATK